VSISDTLQRNLPAIGAAVRNIVIFTTVLSIPLTAAQARGLSAAETSSWILALYGVSGFLSLVLALRYRQPLLVTGNLFFIIFISRLEGQLSYPELVGASILAGSIVLLLGMLGLTERLVTWIPLPVVFGLLAGAVLPLVSDLFTLVGDAPAVVGGTLCAYLVSRRILENRVPAILPALAIGLAIAALAGGFTQGALPLSLTLPEVTLPAFSLPAILTATPVFVVLITLQANLPSIRFLQGQDYDPPQVVIDVVSGVGTMLGSFLGPTGISLSLPVTSLVAGEGAGEHEIRHRAVYLAGGTALLVGLLAGFAVGLAGATPRALLVTLAGLSLLDVLGSALKRVAGGPLRLGPLFAFAVALSEISFLGFGSFFWALVVGVAVTLLLERDEWGRLRAKWGREDIDERA
jgi:benzoate membrane transport protein